MKKLPETRKCEDCDRTVSHYKTPDGGYGYNFKCDACLCADCADANEYGNYRCAKHYDEAEDNSNSIRQTGTELNATFCPSWEHFVNLYRIVHGSNDDLDKPFIRNMRENDLQNAIINMTGLLNAEKFVLTN